MQSIARRLFRSVVPGILFTLLTAGVALDVMVDERLAEEFDATLLTRARALAALVEQEDGEVEIESVGFGMPGLSSDGGAGWFVLGELDGPTIARSASLDGPRDEGPLPADPAGAARGEEDEHGFADVRLPDGSRGRRVRVAFLPLIEGENAERPVDAVMLPPDVLTGDASSLPLASAAGRIPVVLAVAVSIEAHRALLEALHWGLLGTGIAVMLVIVALALVGIRRAVAPLEQVSARVAALDERRLEQRLEVDEPTTEIATLVERFNALLARLHGAFERERRFSGDVAHELRTPLAEMRTLLEVSGRFPDDAALRDGFLADMQSSTLRMQRLVEQLLALSRTEGGLQSPGEPIELVGLVRARVDERAGLARSRGLELRTHLPVGRSVVAGGDLWSIVVANLIGNAAHHADPGSGIDVRLDTVGAGVRLSVSNEARGFDPDDLERMFERLWRRDPARASGEHSGLGLALVRSCAARLGYRARASLDGGRLRVTIDRDGASPAPTPAAAQPSAAIVGQPSAALSAGNA